MLRGHYAPTDFASENIDPGISPEDKLDLIARSPVKVEHLTLCGIRLDRGFKLSLPFGVATTFHLMEPADQKVELYSEYVCVRDSELRGKGLGSRIVRAACRFALAEDERTTIFSTNAARLGLINTAINVFGEENVAVTDFGERWGWMGQKPLDHMLDDYPPMLGKKYIPGSIEARIDPATALAWEIPTYQEIIC